jgi:hypothetical protein
LTEQGREPVQLAILRPPTAANSPLDAVAALRCLLRHANRVGQLAFAPERGSADAVVVKCGTPKSALQFRLARCFGRVAV